MFDRSSKMASSSEERRKRLRAASESRRQAEAGAGSQRRSEGAEDDRYAQEIRRRRARIRAERRRRRQRKQRIMIGVGIILCLILVAAVAYGAMRLFSGSDKVKEQETALEGVEPTGAEGMEAALEAETESETVQSERELLIAEAERLSAMYDYDGAIELLSGIQGATEDSEIAGIISGYEAEKAELVPQDINTITHVFFHSLIVDPENAFDKERWGTQADGYNSVMTTISEFEKMLDEFYRDGFVLVGLHDMAHIETTEDGQEHIGEYDLVPILDRFVEEHPDFSYKGAKACLAFTGYNGILGYRTDETYDPNSDMYDPEKEANHNIEEDRQTAREVVAALREAGYELASHSWGHRDMGSRSFEDMKRDADRWDKNVNQELLGGTCDIILYPFGADVADWHPYTHENQKFDYLWDLGFRYFCGVDSSEYWVQLGKDYLRQGRRNLDGYMMWMDVSGQRDKLSDLFDDVSAIFDPARPTPVTQ